MREFPVFQVAKRGDEGRLCVKRREGTSDGGRTSG